MSFYFLLVYKSLSLISENLQAKAITTILIDLLGA